MYDECEWDYYFGDDEPILDPEQSLSNMMTVVGESSREIKSRRD